MRAGSEHRKDSRTAGQHKHTKPDLNSIPEPREGANRSNIESGQTIHQLAVFSSSTGCFRMTASCPVMRRPRARSTLAPRASLFILSVFSAVGTKRWLCRGLFSSRSRPSPNWWMADSLGSPLGREPMVRTELTDGLPLTEEKRLEARFYGFILIRDHSASI